MAQGLDVRVGMGNSEEYATLEYSRIVKPNPESFFAISTINIKAFITSLQQQKRNQRTNLLQCNTFKLSTSLPVCTS